MPLKGEFMDWMTLENVRGWLHNAERNTSVYEA